MWEFLHYLKFYSELKVWFFVSNGERYEHVEHQDLSHLNYMMISGCGFTHSRGDCT